MSSDHLVYSTDVGRIKPSEKSSSTASKGDGIVRIRRETKGRKGKGVTTISGTDLPADKLKVLCSDLKKACGTGGSVKDGIIEIQGDNRDKIKDILTRQGFTVKFAGG